MYGWRERERKQGGVRAEVAFESPEAAFEGPAGLIGAWGDGQTHGHAYLQITSVFYTTAAQKGS